MTPNQSKTSCDQELLSELIDSLIDQQTCYDRELLSELIDTPIDKMIRAHWPPVRSKTSCDQELLSELVDSLIIQQTSCYWGLLSGLIPSLIDRSLLAIKSSYYSSVTQELINNSLLIGSFSQSSLAICGTTGEVTDTFLLIVKVLAIGRSS